jgi:hypothetical protein
MATRQVAFQSLPAQAPRVWLDGPRVRVDSLKPGDPFIAVNGERYTYVRRDGALSGAHHVVDADGVKTCFAGCAEVVRVQL